MAITNGDFETGDLTGWDSGAYNSYNEIPPGVVSADAKHTGNYGLRTTTHWIGPGGGPYQYSEYDYYGDFFSITGAETSIEFWYRFVSKTASNSDLRFKVFIHSWANGQYTLLNLSSTATADNTWTKVSLDYGTVSAFMAPGQYRIWIQGSGCGDRTMIVDVDDFAIITLTPPPTSDFTYTIIGDQVQFTDTSTGTPTSWDWDFGDGSPHSTLQNPIHRYPKLGGG